VAFLDWIEERKEMEKKHVNQLYNKIIEALKKDLRQLTAEKKDS
jgi:hypothetical protein